MCRNVAVPPYAGELVATRQASTKAKSPSLRSWRGHKVAAWAHQHTLMRAVGGQLMYWSR
jgi:hypothetical protein